MEHKIYDRLDINVPKNVIGPKYPEGIDNGTVKFEHHNKGNIQCMPGFQINYNKAEKDASKMPINGTQNGSQYFVQGWGPKTMHNAPDLTFK